MIDFIKRTSVSWILIGLVSIQFSCRPNSSVKVNQNDNSYISSPAQANPNSLNTQGKTSSRANVTFHDYIASLGKPVLVDFGASSCTPCKLMAPILEDLKQNYPDQFETIFVHVNEEPDKVREFQINVIPTQIFFSAAGVELYRHVGFFSKEDILKTWLEQGITIN